jgi:hypothetical protein
MRTRGKARPSSLFPAALGGVFVVGIVLVAGALAATSADDEAGIRGTQQGISSPQQLGQQQTILQDGLWQAQQMELQRQLQRQLEQQQRIAQDSMWQAQQMELQRQLQRQLDQQQRMAQDSMWQAQQMELQRQLQQQLGQQQRLQQQWSVQPFTPPMQYTVPSYRPPTLP